MKKLAMLSVVLLAVSALSFAGGTQEPKEEGLIHINFWSLFTGGDGEFFDAMVQEFNRTHPDIIMQTDTVKHTDYYTKLITALTAKTAPDVVVVHRNRLFEYVPKGVLYELDPYLKQLNADLDDFYPAVLEPCKFDGKIYSLPLDVHPLIMYYNKDLAAKAGLSSIPEARDDFVAAAQKIQNATGAVGVAADNTTAKYKAYTLTRMFMSLLEQQDSSLLTSDAKEANFNNAEGANALNCLIAMVQDYKITPSGYDYDSSVADFKLGNAGIHINGVWATGLFEQQQGLNFGTDQFPAIFGKHAAWSGSHTLALAAQKEKDEVRLIAATEFILWMTAHGELWAKAGHIPTRKSVTEKAAFKALPHRKDYADAAAYSFPAPRSPQWGQVYEDMSDMLEFAVAKDQNIQEALAVMEKKVNDILSAR
jgi:multiple sugar transport system substrate-binding protein